MTSIGFSTSSRKELAAQARREGVSGWHAMRKEELILALAARAKSDRRPSRQSPAGLADNGKPKAKQRGKLASSSAATSPSIPSETVSTSRGRPKSVRSEKSAAASRSQSKRGTGNGASPRETLKKATLSSAPPVAERKRYPKKPLEPVPGPSLGGANDSLQIEFEGKNWIKVRWDISSLTHARAKAALGPKWHSARAMIRLYDVTSDDVTSQVKARVFEVELKAGMDVWYIPVADLSRVYVLDVGYLAGGGEYFSLITSGRIRAARTSGLLRVDDPTGDKHAETTLQMARRVAGRAESRRAKSQRALGSASEEQHPRSVPTLQGEDGRPLPFSIDAELYLHGHVPPGSRLTMFGEAIETRNDGSFSLKLPLPNGRQVIPCVSVTHSLEEERTIIMAIERSTRELEPRQMEDDDL